MSATKKVIKKRWGHVVPHVSLLLSIPLSLPPTLPGEKGERRRRGGDGRSGDGAKRRGGRREEAERRWAARRPAVDGATAGGGRREEAERQRGEMERRRAVGGATPTTPLPPPPKLSSPAPLPSPSLLLALPLLPLGSPSSLRRRQATGRAERRRPRQGRRAHLRRERSGGARRPAGGGRGTAVCLGRRPAVGRERSDGSRRPARGSGARLPAGKGRRRTPVDGWEGEERRLADRAIGEGGRREGGRGAAAHWPLNPCRSAHRPLPLHFTPPPLGSASSRRPPPAAHHRSVHRWPPRRFAPWPPRRRRSPFSPGSVREGDR
jgi:hypothetical protein